MNEFLYQFLLIAVIVVIFLAERFFVTISFRREMEAGRRESYELRGEFTKLAVLLQAFMMNVKFKNAEQELVSEKKSTDTQVMISRKELDSLRGIQRDWERETMRQIQERLRTNVGREEDGGADDAIEFDAGGFR